MASLDARDWWASDHYGCDITRAEIHGGSAPDLHLSLWDIFARTASQHPENEAVVSMWQTNSSHEETSTTADIRWSYRQLFEKAELLAVGLYTSGCSPGTRLAAIVWNSAEWALCFWAAVRLGMAFVSIDPRVAKSDLERMLDSVLPQALVVQDEEVASAVDDVKCNFPSGMIHIQCSGHMSSKWKSLWGLMKTSTVFPDVSSHLVSDAAALIIFSSGTTGNPKGCVHTNTNLIAQTHDYDPNPDTSSTGRWLIHTPVSHIFGANNALRAWRNGGTAVFPSKAFDVDATIRALTQEKCTAMSATPTLVKLLVANPKFPDLSELQLGYVILGGTTIGHDDVESCRRGLGARFAVQAYGMSEGAPLMSWSRIDPILSDGFHLGVGKVLPGAAARICRVDSHKVLPTGETGELHIGGPSVISSYIVADTESFYDDASGRWFVTGDQAMIDKDGVVHLFGRYKDLIIRGGENIQPAKIESFLTQVPGVQAQIVGIPDKIAGQIAVLVALLPPGVTKQMMAERARQLSPLYVLDAIYTLEELGLDQMPLTPIGKVKKRVLKSLVMKVRGLSEPDEVRAALDTPGANMEDTTLAKELAYLWEKLTGMRLSLDDNMLSQGDSILFLRYCDAVLRKVDKRLYLEDVMQNDTFEKQAHLLEKRVKRQSMPAVHGSADIAWSLLPTLADEQAEKSKRKPSQEFQHSCNNNTLEITGMPIMASIDDLQKAVDGLGITGLHVEGSLPIRSSFYRFVYGHRPQSDKLRIVYKSTADVSSIVKGLTRIIIRSRPILRTFLWRPPNQPPQHAILTPTSQLLDQLIQMVEVTTEEEAHKEFEDDSKESHSSLFMFSAKVVIVDNTAHRYISLTWNHSIIDAVSLISLYQDLDRQISDPTWNVPQQTSYTYFTDLLTQYEGSKLERAAVAFHVQRLRGISRLQEAFWPRQKAPGWMISNDEDSPWAEERRRVREEVWHGKWQAQAPMFRYPRVVRSVYVPNLKKLKNHYGIMPANFTLCALILCNIIQTGSSHAVINVLGSGRSWPFVPPWLEEMLPRPNSIEGPTFVRVLHLFQVPLEETLLDFFKRISIEMSQAQAHEHAPLDKIMEQLQDEGKFVTDASFRQSIVWDISMGHNNLLHNVENWRTLKPYERYDWADCGLFWNAYAFHDGNVNFIASWDTAQMNNHEVADMCNHMVDIMEYMGIEGNWTCPIAKALGTVHRPSVVPING